MIISFYDSSIQHWKDMSSRLWKNFFQVFQYSAIHLATIFQEEHMSPSANWEAIHRLSCALLLSKLKVVLENLNLKMYSHLDFWSMGAAKVMLYSTIVLLLNNSKWKFSLFFWFCKVFFWLLQGLLLLLCQIKSLFSFFRIFT